MYIEEETIENDENIIEDIFNINELLMTLFSSVQDIAEKNSTELIYEMDSTVPRKLRGNPEILLQILGKVLTFALQESSEDEIVLALSSAEDFFYEECVNFKIKETGIDKEKIETFSNNNLNTDLKLLNGKIMECDDSSIHISMPFKVVELGFRRHYRLPDKIMVGKKILLLCANEKTAQSLKIMFAYFLYDVTIGLETLKNYENNLTTYDIVLVDEKIITEYFKTTIDRVQENRPLKYVLFKEPNKTEEMNGVVDAQNFIKPATQEKVFELILSLFEYDIPVTPDSK